MEFITLGFGFKNAHTNPTNIKQKEISIYFYIYLPCTIISKYFHCFINKIPILDISKDFITDLMKSGAMGKGGQIENWNDECLWKTLKIMSGFLLWFQCFLICESWFTCDSTAPHKTVAQNGAFKKITEKKERPEGEERKKTVEFWLTFSICS